VYCWGRRGRKGLSLEMDCWAVGVWCSECRQEFKVEAGVLWIVAMGVKMAVMVGMAVWYGELLWCLGSKMVVSVMYGKDECMYWNCDS